MHNSDNVLITREDVYRIMQESTNGLHQENASRRLAPDTKWLLQVGGALLTGILTAIVVTIQYQLGLLRDEQARNLDHVREAFGARIELVIAQTKEGRIDQSTILKAFEARDTKLMSLTDQVIQLREDRAIHGQRLSVIAEQLGKISKAVTQSQTTASDMSVQMGRMLQQQTASFEMIQKYVQHEGSAIERVSRRLNRLESTLNPPAMSRPFAPQNDSQSP